MDNPRPNKEWEDKKRPMIRNDTSVNKRPRLDVRVISSSKLSGSPLKNVSPSKSFRRTISVPSTSRDSPSPTDEILLSAAKASEEEEAKAVRELKQTLAENAEFKDPSLNHAKVPPTTKASSYPSSADKKKHEAQQTGNNGSSGFDKLFSDDLNEDFVEECMNLATALSQQPKEPAPPMSQAYEYFFQGVKSHSSILEKTVLKPPPIKPSVSSAQPSGSRPYTSSAIASNSTTNKFALNKNNQSFRKPPTPALQKPQPAPNLEKAAEKTPHTYPGGAEAEIRRLELLVEKLTTEKKTIKEAQNTKDGEAAVLRFQVHEGQNQMRQLKATQSQALSAMNAQYNEKLKELQKENENLRSQLQVQGMEGNAVRERLKLLESSHSRIRLVDPRSPKGNSSLNTSALKSQNNNRRPSAFLNRSTFEEDLRSPPKAKASSSNDEHDVALDASLVRRKDDSYGLWYQLDGLQTNAGCSLALRLAGWERIQADDSDDSSSSCSARRIESDPDSSLDLLKIGPARVKKRAHVFDDKDLPGLAACVTPLRTIFLWPESTLESPSAQELLRKIVVECCGVVHYKVVLLKDHEEGADEKVLHERDCDIIERGGEILDLTAEVDLLDDRPWYKGEHGISPRRALGLLSEIAIISSSSSALLAGNLTSRQSPLERHRFTKLPDFAEDCAENRKPSQQCQSEKNGRAQPIDERMQIGEGALSQDTSWSHPDRYWFLEVLAELCLTIVRQRLTNQFNGVFVGLLKLLQNCAQNGDILGEARTIVLRIIRGILLARPSFYTLRCVLHLLKQLANCEDLMTGLCTYNDHDNHQEDPNHGLYYFRSDSCLLQLLCAQLNSAGKSRWHLADPMVQWLLAVFAHTTIPPRWLVPHITRMRQGKEVVDYGDSMCGPRVISTAVTLIYEAFQTLKDHSEREDFLSWSEESDKRSLAPRVMQRAIILLHSLAVNDLSEYMGRVEGDYDALIPGLNRVRQHLNLAPVHEKLLSDLVGLEETDDAPGEIDHGGDEVISENVWKDAGDIF